MLKVSEMIQKKMDQNKKKKHRREWGYKQKKIGALLVPCLSLYPLGFCYL